MSPLPPALFRAASSGGTRRPTASALDGATDRAGSPAAPALLVTATGVSRVLLADPADVSALDRLAAPLAAALGLAGPTEIDVEVAFDAPSVVPGHRRLVGYMVDTLDRRFHLADPWATLTPADVALYDGAGQEVRPAADAITLTQTLALTWAPLGGGALAARETVIFYGPLLVVAYDTADATLRDPLAAGLLAGELEAFERAALDGVLPALAGYPWAVDLVSETERQTTARARATLAAADARARHAMLHAPESPLGRAQAALVAAFAALEHEATRVRHRAGHLPESLSALGGAPEAACA